MERLRLIGPRVVAVGVVMVLAAVGLRLGYELAYHFANPICPFVPNMPQCSAAGFTNSTSYFLAWYAGGAVTGAALGVVLIWSGRTGWPICANSPGNRTSRTRALPLRGG